MDAEDRLARVEEMRAAHLAGTLLDLCDVILADGIPLNPNLERSLWRTGLRPVPPEPSKPLTRREREILDLLGEGLRPKEVASRLFISIHTVRRHVGAIYAKAGVHAIVGALRVFREGS